MLSLPPAPSISISFEPAPVENALISLSLIARPEEQLADSWPARVAAQLNAEERRAHRFVFDLLLGALLPAKPFPDVPAYLVALAAADPQALRERVLAALLGPDNAEQREIKATAFTEAARRRVPGVDDAMLAEALRLLGDPPALRDLLSGHLRMLWDRFGVVEWKRAYGAVPNLVHSLRQRDVGPAPAAALLRHFIPGDLPDAIAQRLAHIRALVVVPTPHAELVATHFDDPATLWLFVSVHTIWGWTLRQEPMRRNELRNRLDTLADETRLHILELVARAGELLAQEIAEQLSLTQPTTSRHLTQLRGLGYLHERRVDGASKAYRINKSTFDWTARALGQLISGERAVDQRETQPATLRRFLDAAGRLTQLPARPRDQRIVLEYLATKFDAGEEFSERAVNLRLVQWHTFKDPATLRRYLVDERIFARTSDGARYWKIAGEEVTN